MTKMSDFISREAAIKLFNFAVLDCLGMEPTIRAGDIIKALKSIPAADVRPAVLCRDCVHYEMGVCLKIYDDGAANKDAWQERKPDDFCSYGEKREES